VIGLKRKLIRALAMRNPRYDRLYHFLCRPNGHEWAAFLRERGDFLAMGDYCYIDPYAHIEDRPLIRLGNNVRINRCMIMGHDGIVNMVNRALGLRLDSVGKIDIRDNVYIGYGAVILPGVTIGPNAVVSVGSVVRSDVAEGDVVAGVPAKRVGRFQMMIDILKAKHNTYPWRHLIEQRDAETDQSLEPELTRMRVQYFYGTDRPSRKLRERAERTILARLLRR
jgi:acetyltransferase-like isoleucine patch superfamily enzyme